MVYKIGALKGQLLSLRQFLTTENPSRTMKNAFYFMLKSLFVLKIFTFLSWHFGYAEKQLYKNSKFNFKIYDITDWTTNNYSKHFAQYLKKKRQSVNEILSTDRICEK